MTSTSFTVNHTKSEHVAIKVQQRSKWLFPFRPIGKRTMQTKPEHVDALEEICAFTKAELYLLDLVRKHMNELNFIKITKSEFTSSEQQKLTSAIKSWLKKGLIKRVRREHYIVNPYFLVPHLDQQSLVLATWIST